MVMRLGCWFSRLDGRFVGSGVSLVSCGVFGVGVLLVSSVSVCYCVLCCCCSCDIRVVV